MADDTTKGLAAITAQLVGTNDKLDGLLTAAQGNLSPAELKAKNQDDDASTNKSNSLLEKIGIGIGNMYESTKKAAKVALKGAGAALIGLALGAATYALGEFLQSDTFKKILKYIKEEVIPGLEKFWDFLKDNWEVIAGLIAGIIAAVAIAKFISIAKKVRLAFLAVKTFMLVTMLENVKGMIGGVVGTFKKAALLIKNAFIAVQVFALETMLPAVKGMIGGALAKFASIAKKIKLAFLAVQAFMMATMLPAVTAFMVPLLPIIAIAAAIGVVLFALKSAFDDFMTTLDETGSISEALKVGISKFMGTILGFIPAMILKLVGWVAGLFGFDDFKSKVDAIDPIQFISDTIKGLFDKIFNWMGLLFADPVTALTELVSGFFGGYLDIASWLVDQIKKPIVWLLKLFGWDDAAASVETFSFSAFAMDMLCKAKDWVLGIFSWAETAEEGDSWIVKTIKGVITTAKEWISSLFVFDGSLISLAGTAINVLTFFPNMVMKGILAASKWLLGLFGFNAAAEKLANPEDFSIGGLIMKAVKTIIDWFKNLLEIDWSNLLDKLVPDWVKNILPGFGSKPMTGKEKVAEGTKEYDSLEEDQTKTNEKIAKMKADLARNKERNPRFSGRRQEAGIARMEAARDKRQAKIDKLLASLERDSMSLARQDLATASYKNAQPTDQRADQLREAKLANSANQTSGSSGTTVADMSQKVVNANKSSFTSVGQPLENTSMAGLVAAQ
jgi:hypothetical protein